MSDLLIGLLGVMLATNQPAAVSNLVVQTTGVSVEVPNANDPVEKEYQAILSEDDDAEAEVDKMIRENEEFVAKGAGLPRAELNRKIRERFEPVRKKYEAFLEAHPNHVRGHVAFASFLGDLHDEEGAELHLKRAMELDPKDPAIYNNLANIYTHSGPVPEAFKLYAKAIELSPSEPTYYHNLGTTVYLFRKDAMELYGINEQQVFDKAFGYYSNAMRLDPDNFPLASDVAQSYYGVRPLRLEAALTAWTNALKIAHDEVEREGVYLHFARLKLRTGRFSEAQAHLDAVTNSMYTDLKKKLQRNLDEAQKSPTNETATPTEQKQSELKPEPPPASPEPGPKPL